MNRRSFAFRSAAISCLSLAAGCVVDAPAWEKSKDSQQGQHPWLSQQYETLAAQNPSLNDGASSVGRFGVVVGQSEDRHALTLASGSAVLLDRLGTVALTGHQIKYAVNEAVVLEFPDLKTGEVLAFQGYLEVIDKKTDLMFATITDLSFFEAIKQGRLHPAKWGHAGYDANPQNASIAFVGFPADGHSLHASAGKTIGFLDEVTTRNYDPVDCKLKAEDRAFPGMSGGGVLRLKSGEFLGIINSGGNVGDDYGEAYFTPSETVYRLYKKSYASRAKTVDFSAAPDAETPAACMGNAVPVWTALKAYSGATFLYPQMPAPSYGPMTVNVTVSPS